MKRLTKFSLIGAGALAMVTAISGCSHFKSPEDRAQWMVDKVSSKLELTEVQQVKLKALSDEMLSTRKEMKLKFGDSREQVMALLDQPTLDQDKAIDIVKSHTKMVDDKAPVMVAAFADFYDSLDAEQQAEVREFMQKHKDRHSHHGPRGFFRD
ncbi:MAG: Spy/CpxP family protein refolding chaperone [Gammaproteobacteria bacterium]|nr:Spy/CpxP family protein refolding chaperone [Gammaproteobacteria bacterium]